MFQLWFWDKFTDLSSLVRVHRRRSPSAEHVRHGRLVVVFASPLASLGWPPAAALDQIWRPDLGGSGSGRVDGQSGGGGRGGRQRMRKTEEMAAGGVGAQAGEQAVVADGVRARA